MERDLLLRVGGWTMRLEKGGWLGGCGCVFWIGEFTDLVWI